MKFYEVRHYDANYPGRDKILAYTGIVLFRYKGKLLTYLKPLKNKTKGFEDPKNPDVYLPKGFIVCRNESLLYHHHYLATGFIDGLKNILGIKSKPKTENPFA
jgi:hypothetical protein